MDATEFKAALVTLWGGDWRTKAPTALEVSLSTLDRYANGHTTVFGPAAVAVRLMLEHEVRRERQRQCERDYRARKRSAPR